MPEIVAAVLTFPTLWVVFGVAFVCITFSGDPNPAHTGKMGMFLACLAVAAIPAVAGSVAIYISL